jgi:predicted GNAT family acetyltransferase
MLDNIEKNTEDQTDPFAKYGGKKVVKNEDPFAKYGGAILKKNESSQPISQEDQSVSNTQPKPQPTSSVTGQQQNQQASATSNGQPPKKEGYDIEKSLWTNTLVPDYVLGELGIKEDSPVRKTYDYLNAQAGNATLSVLGFVDNVINSAKNSLKGEGFFDEDLPDTKTPVTDAVKRKMPSKNTAVSDLRLPKDFSTKAQNDGGPLDPRPILSTIAGISSKIINSTLSQEQKNSAISSLNVASSNVKNGMNIIEEYKKGNVSEGVLNNVIGGIIGFVPDIAVAAMMKSPQAAEGKLVAMSKKATENAIPLVSKYAPKAAAFLERSIAAPMTKIFTAKGAVEGMANANVDEGENMYVEGINGAAKGALEGIYMHGLGEIAGKVSPIIAKGITKTKINNAIASELAMPLANAGVFVTARTLRTGIEEQRLITAEEAATEAGIGIGFSLLHAGSQYKNHKELDHYYDNVIKDDPLNSYSRILNETKENLQLAYDPNLTETDVKELNIARKELKEAAIKEVDLNVKKTLGDEALKIQNKLDAHYSIKNIVENKDALIDNINNNDALSTDQKEYFTKKISSIAESFDMSEMAVKKREFDSKMEAAQSELDKANQEFNSAVKPSEKIAAKVKVDNARKTLEDLNTELTTFIKEAPVAGTPDQISKPVELSVEPKPTETTDNTKRTIEDIEADREKELSKYNERDNRSLEQITPNNPNHEILQVGQKWDTGYNAHVQTFYDETTTDGEGVEVITKVIEAGEYDSNGKLKKAPVVEVTIFDSKEQADKYIEDKYNKVKEKADKKEAQNKVNTKYDKEIADLKAKAEAKPDELKSPIELKEGEELIDVKDDGKGKTYTYTAKSTEKDGVKTTKFEFNRSDKDPSQRNATGVDADKVLDKYNYEIDPEDIIEGTKIIKISEIREGKDSTVATVTFESEKNGNTYRGEVLLKPKEPKAEAKPDVTKTKSGLDLPKVRDEVNNSPVTDRDQNNQDLTRFIPFSIIEAANKNDKLGGQTAREIVQRGGYSVLELDRLLPNWKEMLPGAKQVEAKPEIILSGLNQGFTAVSRNSFDVRSYRSVMEKIEKGESFSEIVDREGKKYVVVGLRLGTERDSNVSGRDNYSFAVSEYNENTPRDIVKTLEDSAKENFKNIYRDFTDKDVVKPITIENPELKTLKNKPKEVKAEVKDEVIVPKEKAEVSGVEITYPTEKEAETRKQERTSSEYVNKTAELLPEENVENIKKELDGDFGLLTAENPMAQPLTEAENTKLNQKAEKWLRDKGYEPRKVTGKYDQAENSFFVPKLTKEDAIAFAKEFNQESVAHSEGLIYQDGSINPRVKAEDNFSFEDYSPESNYVSIVKTKDGLKTFSVGYDFETKIKPTEVKESETDADLEALHKLFDESEQGGKFSDEQVENGKKAIEGIVPDVEWVIHDTNESMKSATGTTNKGEYILTRDKDGNVKREIHINKVKADGTTVAHEVFHAVLLEKVLNDADAQDLTKRMMKAVAKTASPKIKQELEDFVKTYPEYLKDEERLAQLVGILAKNYDQLSKPNKTIIKKWLDKLAKMFGLKPFTDNEVIDLLNTIAGKTARGEAITEKDVEIFKGGKKVSAPSEGLTKRFSYGNDKVNIEIKYVEQERIDELKEKGLLTEPENLSELNGKRIVTTSPDDMLVGSIYANGKEIATGNGGVHFVTKFGDVWANSDAGTANGLAKAINDAYDPKTGKSYLGLVKGTDAKLVSSPQGVTSSLAITESMLDAGLFSLSDFRSAVRSAVKSSGGDIKLTPNGSAKVLKAEVDNFFKDVTSSTFEKRGNVLREIVSNLAKSESAKNNKTEIIKFLDGDQNKGLGVGKTEKSQSLIDLIAKTSAEKLTKGLKTGDIYAVIEIDGKVKVFKDEHQSYPYHIRIVDENGDVSTKKPVLILPKNRRNGKEILTSLDGKTAVELGSAFSGKVGATANMPYGKGIIMDDSVSTTKRSQKSDEDIKFEAKNNSEYVVKDKGEVVGRLKLTNNRDLGKGYLEVDTSELLDKYIGKGIGSDLYRTAAKNLNDKNIVITSSKFRSEKAESMWKKLEKAGEAVKIYSDNKLKRSVYALVNPNEVRRSQKTEWEESKLGKGDRAIIDRHPVLQNAAERYANGEISYEEYLKIKDVTSPIKPITDFIEPAKEEDIKVAVGSKSEGKTNLEFEEGKPVGLRLDIPAYRDKNIWAITVHEPNKGAVMSYNNVARIKDVKFDSSPKDALNIARHKINKATIARMHGDWVPIEGKTSEEKGKNAMKFVDSIVDNPEWSQVGMNPFRHSWFYDRADGKPVLAADELIQIGGLVYAKNVVKTTPYDKAFEFIDKETGSIKRFQKDGEKLIDDYVRISRNNNFSDATIKRFLKSKGFSDADIDVALAPKEKSKNFVKSFFSEDVVPRFKSTAEAVYETSKAVVNALSPKTGVDKGIVTKFYELTGDRNKSNAFVDKIVGEYEKTFDKMTTVDRVEFVDRMKAGKAQATPELDVIAKVISRLDKDLYDEITKYSPNLAWKENHFRVLWKKVPGKDKEKFWSFLSKRPLRGTQGFFKQSTLSSMTEGIAKGGEPHSTNPITMFKLAYDDSMKFITSQRIITSLKKDGVIKFVKSGEDVPEGYVAINDGVAKVYFKSDSGVVKTGEYYIQEGPGRMLNNMLSRDMIRDTKAGKSLMDIKNIYTQVELSLSPFHAVAITLEQIASGAGIGFRKIVNLGDVKGGIKDILTAPFSPKNTFSLGRKFLKFSTVKDFENSKEGKELLRRMPEAAQYVDDFFKGGGLMKQHEDLKANTYKALKENMGKNNYIGATLRALPAINEGIMDPLFNVYIPSLKIGLFMKEFPLILAENKSRLDKGTTTREKLSRDVIDSIDNRLGEMNFDNLYWNKTFKTSMQFMLRSVTWKLGNIRQMGGAAPEQAIEFYNAIKEKRRPNLSPKMAWLFGLSLTQVVLSSIIQGMSLDDDDKDKTKGNSISRFVKRGQPVDFKDIVAPRINSADDKERVIIPTYYKDLLHFWHAPTEYVSSGVSGPFGKGLELYKNKDFYGYEIYDETDPKYKQLFDAAKHSAPEPFSISSSKKMRDKGEPVSKQALSFLGFNKAPGYLEHSDLESEIIDLYRIRNTSVKPLKMKEANDKKKEIRDMYKKDIEKAQEMADEAVNSGLLRPTQVSRLFRDVAKNEDAIVYFFQRLPKTDKEYIYSKMTKEEKAKFDPKNKLGESTEENVEGVYE